MSVHVVNKIEYAEASYFRSRSFAISGLKGHSDRAQPLNTTLANLKNRFRNSFRREIALHNRLLNKSAHFLVKKKGTNLRLKEFELVLRNFR